VRDSAKMEEGPEVRVEWIKVTGKV
jgi:hypothetical protein